MSFISAYHDRYRDVVQVWERTESGKRLCVEHVAPWFFYVPDKLGDFTTITGEPCKKITFSDKKEFDDAIFSFPRRFESDLSPLEKVMTEVYAAGKIPDLTIGFIDIEVDYDPAIGFSSPTNPYASINAITLYRSDLKSYFTLGVPPRGWDDKLNPDMEADNYFICRSERELLEQFLDLIEDVDLLSGWNSEFFDLPYIGKRIELLFGQIALKRMGFPGAPGPRWSERERFKGSKEKELVLDLISRVHLDYMKLFIKFNLGGRASFSLAAIANDELDIPKLDYNGTLADLYRNDFKHFLNYNRRDVEILVQLDKKFKYIALANTMVHEATVNFSSIFGSVALIDTAIINFAHNILKRIVNDKVYKQKAMVEGALVLTPRIGLHKWTASCDIESLYPSTYRTLNLSPEKIIGQLVECESGWQTIYKLSLDQTNESLQQKELNLIIEGTDDVVTITAQSMLEMMKDKKWAISAFGTILDQGNGEGLLPAVLTYWFTGRKELQGKKKEHGKIADEILTSSVKLPEFAQVT